MNKPSLLAGLAALALTACGSEPAPTGNDADSFAARIGKGDAGKIRLMRGHDES